MNAASMKTTLLVNGRDGAPTADGWYVVETTDAVGRKWFGLCALANGLYHTILQVDGGEYWQTGVGHGTDITRHAPNGGMFR